MRKCVSDYIEETKIRKELESELEQKKELERQFKKLASAHQQQSIYSVSVLTLFTAIFIFKLQDENRKLDKFKSTIKNQEMVIQKMEELLSVIFSSVLFECS